MIQIPNTPRLPHARYTCVVVVASHIVKYIGSDDEAAAELLEPGTCFGNGGTPEEAELAAVRAAITIKQEARAAVERERESWRRRLVGG